MVIWKYIIMAFVLVGFVFAYPYINNTLNLPVSYSAVVLAGFVVLGFVITPLYWKAIVKQADKEKQKYSRAKQPWE